MRVLLLALLFAIGLWAQNSGIGTPPPITTLGVVGPNNLTTVFTPQQSQPSCVPDGVTDCTSGITGMMTNIANTPGSRGHLTCGILTSTYRVESPITFPSHSYIDGDSPATTSGQLCSIDYVPASSPGTVIAAFSAQGVTDLHLSNLSLQATSSFIPDVVLLLARNVSSVGSSGHFNHVKISGSVNNAVVYSIGYETTYWDDFAIGLTGGSATSMFYIAGYDYLGICPTCNNGVGASNTVIHLNNFLIELAGSAAASGITMVAEGGTGDMSVSHGYINTNNTSDGITLISGGGSYGHGVEFSDIRFEQVTQAVHFTNVGGGTGSGGARGSAPVYVSGGSASGTGVCTLTSTNGGGTGATGTIVVTAGVLGTVAITATGTGYTTPATTWTAATSTATCSGTVTTSGGVLTGSNNGGLGNFIFRNLNSASPSTGRLFYGDSGTTVFGSSFDHNEVLVSSSVVSDFDQVVSSKFVESYGIIRFRGANSCENSLEELYSTNTNAGFILPSGSENCNFINNFVNSTPTTSPGGRLTVNLPIPSTPTLTPSTMGGTLAANTYYYEVSAGDGTAAGFTVPGPEVSATTTGSTGSVAFTSGTYTVLPAAQYRIWRGTSPGAENCFQLTAVVNFTDIGGTCTAGTPPILGTAVAMSWGGTASGGNKSQLYNNGITHLEDSTEICINCVGANTTTLIGAASGDNVQLGVGGVFTINNTHMQITNGGPVLSSCGGTTAVNGGNDIMGNFTIGAGGTGCVLTWASTYVSTPRFCLLVAESGTQPTYVRTSATVFTVSNAIPGIYDYICAR